MIKIRNINKSYGALQVLDNVNVDINRGEVVTIVGPSGAGKTTLLQIMGTLDSPDSGSVLYDGQDVLSMKDSSLARFRNQNIGFVFQFHQLLPEFTALENVMMPALIGGMKQKEASARAKELLEYMGLGERLELHNLFFRLRDEMQQTFVIVTHDETLAGDADRVLYMRDGRIVNDVIKK